MQHDQAQTGTQDQPAPTPTPTPQFTRLLSKRELALVALAGDDASRASMMSGVHIEPSGLLTATNAHVLGTLRLTSTTPPEEFPLRYGLADSFPIPPQGLTIPTRVINAATGTIKKSTLSVAALWIGHDRAALYTTDLEGWAEHDWRLDEMGPYPDWRRVWNDTGDAEPTTTIALSAGCLALVESVARQCVYTGFTKRLANNITAVWRFHGPNKAVEFYVGNADATLRGLLMPMQFENDAITWGVPS